MDRRRFLQTSALASLAPREAFGAPLTSTEMPDMLLAFLSRG